MLEEYQEILTVDEACEILRIGYNAMYELLSTGKLKAYRNGRVWRIPKVAVQDFILVNFEHRAPLARKTSPALTKI